MSRPDPSEWQEVLAPGAFDDMLPATVPVRLNFSGPAIGEATVTRSEDGIGLDAEIGLDGGLPGLAEKARPDDVPPEQGS